MAGEAITHLIFFIGAIVIAVGVIGMVSTNVQSITASYSLNSKTLADQLKTDITIINDPAMVPNSSCTYSFFVKNTGTSTLENSTINMFVDGTFINVTRNTTVMDGGSIWYPTYVLRVNATSGCLGAGDHSVRVVAGNGVFDTMPFRI